MQRWFTFSLIHPLASFLLMGSGSALPSGGLLGAFGFYGCLAGFVINLPGIVIVRQFYTSTVYHGFKDYMMLALTVILTWALVVIPLCLLLFRKKQKPSKTEPSGSPNPLPPTAPGDR